jgi:hypothetical protein
MKRYKRWNFSSSDDGIIACDGEHEKGQHCSHEPLTIEETLNVILEMQELLPVEVFNYNAKSPN